MTAGDKIDLQWTAWPSSHHGPVLDYLARCSGECTSVDKSTLTFFKIDASGLTDDTTPPGTWASDKLIGKYHLSTYSPDRQKLTSSSSQQQHLDSHHPSGHCAWQLRASPRDHRPAQCREREWCAELPTGESYFMPLRTLEQDSNRNHAVPQPQNLRLRYQPSLHLGCRLPHRQCTLQRERRWHRRQHLLGSQQLLHARSCCVVWLVEQAEARCEDLYRVDAEL